MIFPKAFLPSCVAIALVAISSHPAFAQAPTSVPAVIADAMTGEVLYAEDATRPWFPASTTKLMTAYVALKAVQQGLIRFDTPIVASANAARQRPSKVGIKPGQEITLENALKILMVKSANDIAVVVAEGVGGSVPGFANLMNREAARLGMRESHFVNPHGLHEEEQVSSARDMALLSRAILLEFPDYRELFSIPAVKLGQRVYQNTNGLIGRYSGAMGMKTGFICASGFNLVSSASRDGRVLIAVVFGASTGADRTLKAAQLLDRGFSSSGGGFWGSVGAGRSLASLPASAERSAPNRRADVCGRRGSPASEEEENQATVFAPESTNSDRVSLVSGSGRAPSEAMSVGVVSGGRITLAPRAVAEPLLVYLGRKPGSTEIARLPAGMEAPKTNAQALAAAPPARRANGAPLALPNAITSPSPGGAARIGAAKASPQRPAAAAGLANRPKVTPPKEADETKDAPALRPAVSAKAPDAAPKPALPNSASKKQKKQPAAKTASQNKAAPKNKAAPEKRTALPIPDARMGSAG